MIFRSLPNKGSFNLGSFFRKSPDPPMWVDSEKNEAPKQKNYKINYQLKKRTHTHTPSRWWFQRNMFFFNPWGRWTQFDVTKFFIVFPDGLVPPPQPPTRHLKPNQEVLESHQSYAKRLQSLRAQHGGERMAFEAAEVGETAVALLWLVPNGFLTFVLWRSCWNSFGHIFRSILSLT